MRASPERSAPTGEVAPALLAALARGRARFNRAEHWASHEALETAWHAAEGSDKTFVKGLIKAAAAFHKLLVQDNPAGAIHLLEGALMQTSAWPEAHLGLDMRPFRAQLRGWLLRLASGDLPEATIRGLPRLEWTAQASRSALRLDAIALHQLELDGRRAILVSVEMAGLRGWGECGQPWGHSGVWSSLQQGLAPALLTEPIAVPSELAVTWTELCDDPYAAAGVEMALWDLWARREGLSLTRALGLVPRPLLMLGRARQLDPSRLSAELDRLAARGYRHLELPARPNADRRTLPGVVEALSGAWSIDLGQAYHRAGIQALKALEALGPAWMAEPVPDWDVSGAQRLCRWLRTPIARGGWRRVAELEGALRLAALDHALIDPLRCGLTRAIDMAGLGLDRDLPMGLRSTAVTPVGAAALLALAAHPGLGLPCDPGPAIDAPAPTGFALDDAGRCAAPEGPGLGLTPDPDWLASCTLRSWRIEG